MKAASNLITKHVSELARAGAINELLHRRKVAKRFLSSEIIRIAQAD